MKKRLSTALFTAFFTAVLLTALAALPAKWNPLYRLDNEASDLLYQKTEGYNKDIVVFGIDQETIDTLGPVTGLRGAMARVIETLNRDPEKRPAVIGIDIMYTGNNEDAPEADRLLAETAARYDNIVTAADARFSDEMILTDTGTFSLQTDTVIGWYEPYEDLKNSVTCGHINQSLDADGIFRHARLFIDTPEDGRIYSLAKVIYDRWCQAKGTEPLPEPAVSADGYYYLPFSGGENDFSDGKSFLDLYEQQVDPYFYQNKIVLIGPTARGMQDEYFTSLDHSQKISGVNIQANMVSAFMKGTFPAELSKSLQLLILFLLVFLLTIFLWNRHVIPSFLTWLTICLGWIELCYVTYQKASLILPVLYVPVGASIVLVGSLILNYIRSQKEKQLVTDTFGYYMDPIIRDQLISKGPEALNLGGTMKNIAVLFVDVRGFTSMSEVLDAQTVVEILNRYLTLTTNCIMKNHGTLDKFVGDCTMAIWNAPLEQEDAVYLACRAAMDMLDGSAALSKELKKRYDRTVSFGIGIHYGPAVVGNIGAPKRMDYTAIGDTVNTAARLEAVAEGGTILISRAVADALGDNAVCTSLGDSIHLKGKTAGFEILKLERL